MRLPVLACLAGMLAFPVFAKPLTIAPTSVQEWKAVYGRIEPRDRIAARARIGGSVIALSVSEGEMVEAGQELARIVDEKLTTQIAAIDAALLALNSQLDNAQTELGRGEALQERGVATVQQLDNLRTQVDVLTNQIAAKTAERRVVEQQAEEGAVLAPAAGRVLAVPVTAGAVLLPGEAVAEIGAGGFYLRIAVPERHASALAEGDAISIETAAGNQEGKLAKLYPQIENGRVVADVEVAGLDDAFADARVLVRLPVGSRDAILLPPDAVHTRSGLDFVTVQAGEKVQDRAILLGGRHAMDGTELVEVISGLSAGDVVVTGDE